jgi:lipopolysaccharide heptosyltransferase I
MIDRPAGPILNGGDLVAGAPSFLIVRLSAVGDCIQTMPLAVALRERFPRAHITWVVEKIAAPLVEALPAVDRTIIVPKRYAFSLPTLTHLRTELRERRFDVALDPQGLTKSGFIGWLSGAARRIGFRRPAAREINPWMQTELVFSRAVHRVNRYLELLDPLGIEPPAVGFGLQIPASAEGKAHELAARPELQGGYAVLNPGAGWDSKRWPVERFAQTARHLAAWGVPSVVTWGGRRENLWAEQIVAAAGPAAILAPPTSLLELAAVLRAGRLFVGSDTGPLHLAAAMGTPCIGLFGASEGTACGPFGGGHIVLQAALDNSMTRKRPGSDNWAMRRISVEMVMQACDEMLRRPAIRRMPSERAA